MRFREIAPDVYRASRRATNIYLVDQGAHSVLIDTGEPGFATGILAALEGHSPVRQILLTHAHYDHAGSAAAISRELNAKVFAHPADADLLRQGLWRRPAKPAPTLVGHLMNRMIANRFPDQIKAIAEIKHIDDESELAITGLKTIALPGHCAGQIGFGVPQSTGTTVWIVGDVIMTAPWLGEPILYENRSKGLASIAALAQSVQPGDLICPGHGVPLHVEDYTINRLLRLAGN